MPLAMDIDIKIVGALIAAVTSLAVAILGQIFNPISQRRLEKQKAELQTQIEEVKAKLADQTSAEAARRAYEYEARKRLYAEVEPLFFKLYEAVEECYYRIASLARTSRQGHLGTHADSWIDQDGYYLRSTAYKLILPAVMFRLIQRRMTFLDLKLDNVLRLRYLLLKNLVHSFVDAFDFAALEPRLTYDPVWEDPTFRSNPAVYRPQGFVVGDLENLLDELVMDENGTLRALSFGEFEKHLQAAKRADSRLHDLIALYRGFAPEDHPVLARMIVGQAGLCSLLMATYKKPLSTADLGGELNKFLNSDEVRNQLQWKDQGQDNDLKIARGYLDGCLKWIEEAP